MNGIELTREIAAIADEKQASEIVALEVGPLVGYTDAIVVCTARNERLANAIGEERGRGALPLEGRMNGSNA